MAVKVLVTLDDPDGALATGAYGAGAAVQLQRATDEAFTTPVDVARIAIVTDTYAYAYWDTAGTTATWYRWRLENTGDTVAGEWSAVFQGWDPATASRNAGAYATVDDVQLRRGGRASDRDSEKLARMERALVDSRERLDEELALPRAFFRSPQSGATEVRVFDGTGTAVLHVHGGIVALTAARIKVTVDGAWIALDTNDIRLEHWANNAANRQVCPSGEPYDHVVLIGTGSYTRWPALAAGVELTGAYGWPRPPRRAAVANTDLALQELAADPTFAGGQVGPAMLGAPTGPNRMPESVYRLARAMSRRFWCAT